MDQRSADAGPVPREEHEELGTIWPVTYDRDPEPLTQVRLWRDGEQTRLAVEQFAFTLSACIHLNRHAARELHRALGEALGNWQKAEPELAALGQPTEHPEDRRRE